MGRVKGTYQGWDPGGSHYRKPLQLLDLKSERRELLLWGQGGGWEGMPCWGCSHGEQNTASARRSQGIDILTLILLVPPLGQTHLQAKNGGT